MKVRAAITSSDGSLEYTMMPVIGSLDRHVIFQVDTVRRTDDREHARRQPRRIIDDQGIFMKFYRNELNRPPRGATPIAENDKGTPVAVVPPPPPPPPPGSGFLPDFLPGELPEKSGMFDYEAQSQRELEKWKAKQRAYLELDEPESQ